MDTFLVQLITVISLLMGNILFGTLPLLVVKIYVSFGNAETGTNRRLKCSSFLLYFGGGVFIANAFLVLMPQSRIFIEDQDAHDHIETEEPSGHRHDSFPIPEFIVSCSFFGAYILQEIVMFIISKLRARVRKCSDTRVKFCSCAQRHTECSRTYKGILPDQIFFEQSLDNKLLGSVCPPNLAAAKGIGSPEISIAVRSDLLRSSIISQTIPNYGTLTTISEPPSHSPLPVLSPPVLLDEQRLVHQHFQESSDQTQLFISSIIAAIALIVQYMYLGASLGLSTNSSVTWNYLLFACLQNFLLTFSSTADLLDHTIHIPYIPLNISLLSIVSPIAAIIAIVQPDSFGQILIVTNSIVAAVVCGILIYTTFYATLMKKIGNVGGFKKFISILLGSCSMAGVHYAMLESKSGMS